MYRNVLDDEFRVRVARLKSVLRDHDRGVLLGLVFSAVPIPPVALAGFIIGLLNLRLLARRSLPESERRFVHLSLVAALVSFVVGSVLFVAIGWIVLQALSIRLPALLSRLQDLANGFWSHAGPLAPRHGLQDI